MNIGINACFWGQESTGTGQYLHHLVRMLRASQTDTTVRLFAPGAITGEANGELSVTHTPVDRLGPDAAKLWFEQIIFPRLAARAECDVAHVPYFAPPLFHRVPLVVTIHDLIPLILPAYRGSLRARTYTALVARAAARADLVLTDSLASARDISRLLTVDAGRVRVIPLAADARYGPLDPPTIARALRRYAIDRPYLLYLGGFDVRKNVPLLLEAFQQAALPTDLVFVVAGRLPTRDSAFAPDPRPIAARLGLKERVQFIGFVPEEDKPALYSGARAFVFPSRYEGFGLPVLEALSCGTPVVVSSGSSLQEVAGPGGLYVSPGSADELAQALERLAKEPGLRRELSEAGLAHAGRFSWRQVALETRQAYEHACQVIAR